MDKNHILIIAIIIVIGIILVFGTYYLYITIYNKKHEKKIDNIFDTNNLVEEESLMNVMDQKANLEFKNEESNDRFRFTESEVTQIESQTYEEDKPINPFGIDMTKTTHDNVNYVEEEERRSQNKFIN